MRGTAFVTGPLLLGGNSLLKLDLFHSPSGGHGTFRTAATSPARAMLSMCHVHLTVSGKRGASDSQAAGTGTEPWSMSLHMHCLRLHMVGTQ